MRFVLFILALTISSGTAQGQESTPAPQPVNSLEPTPDSSQDSRDEDGAAEGTLENGSVGAETPDIFVPSEDISEDISVAFPVDI